MIKFFSGKKTPLYIFDLDGTLALIDHRRHLVESNGDKSFKPNWAEFYRQCVNDKPNWPVITTALALKSAGAEVWVWSGRSDEVRSATEAWLSEYMWISPSAAADILKMRNQHDYTPDDQLKKSWLDALSDNDRSRLVGIFDDRQKVVNMYRETGVAVFQVAPGDF